jgi:sec-independent protein translocase protein TatA
MIVARRRDLRRSPRLNGTMAMGGLSIWHWMLFGAVALLLFGGKGKISDIMGDVAKGIKSFKKGMADDESAAEPASPPPPRSLETRAGAAVDAKETNKVN